MKNNSLLFLAFLLLIYVDINAQGKDTYKVAIFLYDGVELLDFSGPGEVFGATNGFEAYTVSVDGEPIKSQGFVTVDPEYSLEDVPAPDVVVYPGGGARVSSEDPRVMKWVKDLYTQGAIQMSVCTGARILATSGLLDGLNVTTWYGFTGSLQEMLPDATVLENTRFVDSGKILTTAGVSAGIDGALHLVDRIKGKDVAESTAKYMEYDKWERGDGQVDYQNPLVASIKSQGVEQVFTTGLVGSSGSEVSFYEGELKNLAFEYMEEGSWDRAALVLEQVIKAYPNSVASYEALSSVYEKQGKFAPPGERAFMSLALEQDPQKAVEVFRKARETYPGWLIARERYVNYVGYQYLQQEKYDVAIEFFRLNVEVYPDSPNVYDSLGEAYLKSGDKKMALKYYRKVLQLNPEMESAVKAVKQLQTEG